MVLGATIVPSFACMELCESAVADFLARGELQVIERVHASLDVGSIHCE